MTQSHDWLDEVLAGQPSEAAIERLVVGVQTWWRSGTRSGTLCGARSRPTSLARCLGLPASPESARLALRDHHLRDAARHLDGAPLGPWQTARALHAEVQRFTGHQWPCWSDLELPPPYARPLDAALHKAMRAAGGRLRFSARRLAQILAA